MSGHVAANPLRRRAFGLPTLRRAIDLRRWPPAVQIVVLSVVLSALLAIALTVLGYVHAAHGLKEEAETALSSDALVVSDAIDSWNAQRLAHLRTDAAIPAIRRYALAGPNPPPGVK